MMIKTYYENIAKADENAAKRYAEALQILGIGAGDSGCCALDHMMTDPNNWPYAEAKRLSDLHGSNITLEHIEEVFLGRTNSTTGDK